MATHARQQYFADESSLSKEKREFSIAEEVQQKIDSIEEGAQVNTIETIKVNGSEVQPDENKAVDLTIPGVVDSLDSTSSTDALSARQGKVLYDYIQDVSHIGHFLALWDASTGLPVTDPETSPYIYNTGDFYTVSVVASGGGTNYKPDGTQYVIGQASTAVDTDDVAVNDFYFYDGQVWRHMKNSGAGSIAIDGSLSTTSTNPVENRVITNALNGKADATDINTKTFFLADRSDLTTAQEAVDWYRAGNNPIIILGKSAFSLHNINSSTAKFVESTYFESNSSGVSQYLEYVVDFNMSDRTVTSISPHGQNMVSYLDTMRTPTGTFTPTLDWQPATKKYVDDHAGTTYTAGANIQISNENVISATDTKYTAGTGISIDANNVISNTQTSAEWGNITGTLSDQADLQNALDAKADDEDVNVKVFHIATTNDLINAQEAIDWWEQGRLTGAYTPLIEFGGGKELYGLLSVYDNYQAIFTALTPEKTQSRTNTTVSIKQVVFSLTGTPGQPQTVTAISTSNYLDINYLDTDTSYSSSYTPQYDGSPATKKYVDDHAGTTYTAGANIQISNENVISATDTKYTAGTGISIDANNVISNTQTSAEWGNITGTLSNQTDLQNALNTKADNADVNTKTFYLSSTSDLTNAQAAVDWFLSGKNPIIYYSGAAYNYAGQIIFEDDKNGYRFVASAGVVGGSPSGQGVTPSSVENFVISLKVDSNNTVTNIYSETLDVDVLPAYSSSEVVYTPINSWDPATKKYVDDNIKTYTAGTNVQISSSNVISATDTTYNAGEGIKIGTYNDYSAMQGPCPDGFHVPTSEEWQDLLDIYTGLGLSGYSDFSTYFKFSSMPGARKYSDGTYDGTRYGCLRASNEYNSSNGYCLVLNYISNRLSATGYYPKNTGLYVRGMKNKPVSPDNNWTIIFDGSSIATGAGIFHNSTLGLISASSDGTNWITIQDKNVGATTVWNSGDTVTQANTGKTYQRGNNYAFDGKGGSNPTTSSTKVNASTYGPGNYYSSSTFITGSDGWDTSNNANLWGGVTGVVTLENAITNTGVLSVNGQTGDVTVTGGDMKYSDFNWQAKTGTAITLDLASTITPTANFTVNAPSTIKDGQTYILRVNNGATAYTMTLGTNVTNPYSEVLTLTANGIDQFVFLAVGGNLELQPSLGGGIDEYVESVNGVSGPVTLKTVNNTSIVGGGNISVQATLSNITAAQIKTGTATAQRTVTAAALAGGLIRISDDANNILANGGKLWAGTQANYEALGTYDETTVYLTI